jgi:hypothetical protein
MALRQILSLLTDLRIPAVVLVGLAVLYYLPTWGERVLAFMRDLDDYRSSR